jgi:hypothetical protein
MKRSLFRVAALAAAGTVAAALAVASPASAAPNQYAPSIGTAVGTPLSGSVASAPRVVTTGLCPTGTTAINGFVDSTAAGLVGAVGISSNTTDIPNISTSGITFSFNLLDVAASQGKTLVNGRYELSVVCLPDLFGSPGTAQFDAVFDVTGGATATSAGTTFTFVAPALPATTTTLAVTPAGPVTLGAPVTLTATVNATGVTPAGSVQFKSGTSNVGAAVPVGAGGVATLTTTALPPGANQALTADFTPAAPATTQGSTSNTVTFTVNAPAQASTLALASSPAAPTTADVVALTATVSSTTTVNVGTVTFLEGTTTLGTGTVTNGTATLSLVGVTAGSHTYTANYAANASFLASTATLTITVTAFTGASDIETITTSVNAGTITLTAGGTVALGPLALNANNTLLVATPKDINTVTVTDTRAGNLGFTVSGQVTDFSGPGTSKINGDNLGWTPKVLTQPGTGITAGPVVPAGNGLAVGAAAPAGTGLKTSRVLATAPAGAGFGTSTYSATLALNAPTTTTAGTYSATLTLTAL